MKTLTTQEIFSVSGAGDVNYMADISALSSTIYVGSFIGGFAKGAIMELGALGGSNCGAGFALNAMTGIVAPIAYFGAPALLAATAIANNPELRDGLVNKYHAYFG